MIDWSSGGGHVWDHFFREVWWRMHINLRCDRTHVYHLLPSDSPFTPCVLSVWDLAVTDNIITLTHLRLFFTVTKNSIRANSSFLTELFVPRLLESYSDLSLALTCKERKSFSSLPVRPSQQLFFCDEQDNCPSTFYLLSISFVITIRLPSSHIPHSRSYWFEAVDVFVLAKCACKLLNVPFDSSSRWLVSYPPQWLITNFELVLPHGFPDYYLFSFGIFFNPFFTNAKSSWKLSRATQQKQWFTLSPWPFFCLRPMVFLYGLCMFSQCLHFNEILIWIGSSSPVTPSAKAVVGMDGCILESTKHTMELESWIQIHHRDVP